MSEQKVILANNENSPLQVLKNGLAKQGFQVTTCTSGFDTLDEMKMEPGDLVVAAADLPDMSGFQLSNLLKTNPATTGVKVVVLGNAGQVNTAFTRAGHADLVIERDEAEFREQGVIDQIKALLNNRTDDAIDKETIAGSRFIPSSLSGGNLVDSYKHLLNALLSERSVHCFTTKLFNTLDQPEEFAREFSQYLYQQLDVDAAGLLLLSGQPQPLWIVAHPPGISSAALEKLQSSALKAAGGRFSAGKSESLEKAGSGIKTTESIVISQPEGNPLSVISLGWTSKHHLDEQAKALIELLRVNMIPVIKALASWRQLQQIKQEQAIASSIDAVTGLYNVEFLIGFLQQQLLFSARLKLPVALIMLDIDGFLDITQTYGAQAGDLVLAALSRRIGGLIRSSDLLARYSGDQFAVVLPNTDLTGCKILAEKLRSDIEQLSWGEILHKTARVTVSIGCAKFQENDANPETILRDAKVALMSAKENGRNRVVI